MTLLVVGQSHVAAIRAAHAARRASGGKFPRSRGLHTLEARFLPELVADEGSPERVRYGDVLTDEIRQEVALYSPRVASMIGGNAHNALALVRHPRGYDFRLSEGGAGPPPEPDAEPIPEALVRAALEARLEVDFRRMRLLRALIGPFVHIESPPPLRDDALIREMADAWFREQGVETLGVAPAGLRWRMWRLNSRLFRAEAERIGCSFLAVPAAVHDGDGFLRPELAADATHGDAAYGELIIQAIEALPA